MSQQKYKQPLVATTTGFLLLGIFGGSFVSMIPGLQAQFAISFDVLGGLLLLSPVGSLIVMIAMPFILQRVNHGHVARLSLVSLPIVLLITATASSILTLGVAIFLIGVSNALVGISLNTYCVDIESTVKKHLVSRAHAANSMGALIGAGCFAVLLSFLQNRDLSGLIMTVVLSLTIGLIWLRFTQLPTVDSKPAKLLSLVDTGWPLLFLLVAASLFLIQLAEGAVSDWAGIFMTKQYAVGSIIATSAYIGFMINMTIVRVFGAVIIKRLGRWRTFRNSVAVAAIGMTTALTISSPVTSIIGFSLFGWGVALLVPMLISGAGIAGGHRRDQFISQVSTFSVIGLMAGPALIGAVAHQIGLQFALFIPVIALALAAIAVYIIRANRSKIKQC